MAARACYLAGFTGSATTLAEPRFGVPIFGTMAHSFIQAHGDEESAFLSFARSRPEHTTLLIDTYDTEEGARKVVGLVPRLKEIGVDVRGVRLDSGDLAAHARRVRAILDEASLHDIAIFASDGLDEQLLQRYTVEDVPIDGYGIGTSLTTLQDAPALDCAYKIQEYAGAPKRKRSEGKATWPGRKQVWRRYADGVMAGDILTLEDDAALKVSGLEPLIEPVIRAGRRIGRLPSLEQARERTAADLQRLPQPLRALHPDTPYPVVVSDVLRALARAVDKPPKSGIGAGGDMSAGVAERCRAPEHADRWLSRLQSLPPRLPQSGRSRSTPRPTARSAFALPATGGCRIGCRLPLRSTTRSKYGAHDEWCSTLSSCPAGIAGS
jgi:nicotinate phosphoribosyltransferase